MYIPAARKTPLWKSSNAGSGVRTQRLLVCFTSVFNKITDFPRWTAIKVDPARRRREKQHLEYDGAGTSQRAERAEHAERAECAERAEHSPHERNTVLLQPPREGEKIRARNRQARFTK